MTAVREDRKFDLCREVDRITRRDPEFVRLRGLEGVEKIRPNVSGGSIDLVEQRHDLLTTRDWDQLHFHFTSDDEHFYGVAERHGVPRDDVAGAATRDRRGDDREEADGMRQDRIGAPGIAREAAEMPLPELVVRLREAVGARLVAYVGNVKTTSAVSAWADGRESPDDENAQRLRLTFEVVRLLQERYVPATISSWLKGMNPTSTPRRRPR